MQQSHMTNLSYILHEHDPYCWICRRVIHSKLSVLSCSGPCKRIYHQNCLEFYLNLYSSKIFSAPPSASDSQSNGTTCGDMCKMCRLGYVGCSVCLELLPIGQLQKCSLNTCGSFYCQKGCILKPRLIYLSHEELTAYFTNMKLPLDVVEIGNVNIICPQHFCYSCYDCDKYMYGWEKRWRRELCDKYREWNIAWDFLRRTCKGSIESSYFNKAKCLVKPPRMPALQRIVVGSGGFGSLDFLEGFCTESRSTIYACIRCEHSWCTQCLPPDASYIHGCNNTILCHNCLHRQVQREARALEPRRCASPSHAPPASLILHSNSQNVYRQLNSQILRSYNASFPRCAFYINKLLRSDALPVAANDSAPSSAFGSAFIGCDRRGFIHLNSNYCSEKARNALKVGDSAELCGREKTRFHLGRGTRDCAKWPKLYLAPAGDKGLGVFSASAAPEGQFICEYTGQVITQLTYRRKLLRCAFGELDDGSQTHWYIMNVCKDVYIDSTKMGNISRYINHSCEPNCVSAPVNSRGVFRMCIFAKRDICPGEEITYNYGFQSKGLYSGFDCVCGSKRCRGRIGVSAADSQIERVVFRKLYGTTADSLNDLAREMCSGSGGGSRLRPRPVPLDVLNGLYTPYELECFERAAREREIYALQALISSPNFSNATGFCGILGSNFGLRKKALMPPKNGRPSGQTEYLYTKLLALNGQSLEEFCESSTKKFAIDMPWGLLPFDHTSAKSVKCTSTANFFMSAKRFFQCLSIVSVKHRFGGEALTNVQNFFDLSWGLTEHCVACGGYGDCSVCDGCGNVLHDSASCGDFITGGAGETLCGVCQNSPHRMSWLRMPSLERERVALKLYLLRLSLCNSAQISSVSAGCDSDYAGYLKGCASLDTASFW